MKRLKSAFLCCDGVGRHYIRLRIRAKATSERSISTFGPANSAGEQSKATGLISNGSTKPLHRRKKQREIMQIQSAIPRQLVTDECQ
jgi:hypothetical protein